MPLLTLLALILSISPTSARDWQQQAESRLRFQGSQQGETFDGRFQRFESRISFDPDNLAQAGFDVRIDLASVDSENSERDQAVRGSDWFDVGRFPQAHFRTLAFRALGEGRFEADAELSLRGHTQALVFPFSWREDAAGGHLRASMVLNRLNFGLGSGEWADDELIGTQVTVTVDLLLRESGVGSREAGSGQRAAGNRTLKTENRKPKTENLKPKT
ncbi:MAG: YceI family protein [Lysobacterales bacterium]